MPQLDFNTLKKWAQNENLRLTPQDEELLLADGKYLDLILKLLDTTPMPRQKSNLLIDALCIIVYDNTIDANLQRDITLKNRVITELNKRQSLLKQADKHMPDFIKKVVYPQLRLPN